MSPKSSVAPQGAGGVAEARRERRSNPRYKTRRAAMITAANDLFLTAGYDINLDEVAARAGVSKKTLYNHFGTKLSLLEAVVQTNGERFIQKLGPQGPGGLRETLTHYAELYQFHSFTAEGIALYRLMVADVSKFPEIAGDFYRAGIDRVVAALTLELEKCIEAGEIAPVDPRATAERFIGAVTGLVRHRAYAGLGIDSDEDRRRYMAGTIELFLKGLRPD